MKENKSYVDYTCDGCKKVERMDQLVKVQQNVSPYGWHVVHMGAKRPSYILDELHFCSFDCICKFFKTGGIS